MNYRRLTIEGNDSHTAKQLTRQIKQLARKIKLDRLLAGLKDSMWDPVSPAKSERKDTNLDTQSSKIDKDSKFMTG